MMSNEIKTIDLKDKSVRRGWQNFLMACGIKNFDDSELNPLDITIAVYENEEIVGTGSIAGDVIKYVAVQETTISGHSTLFNQLMTKLENFMAVEGRFHQFVFTKPIYQKSFEYIGFKTLAECEQGILLEKGLPDIKEYLSTIPRPKTPIDKVASVVINANPFTNGHRFLIEEASRDNELVYVFVLNQEASLFHTDERIALVKLGVQDLSNVIVVNGGAYIISYLTFPAYFLKHNDSAIDYQTTIDVRLFKYKIASVLGITSRYVGSEPLSHTTNLYNQKLISELNPQIEVHVIQRKLATGDLGVISARTVREAIDKGDETVWQRMVPETTQHFISNNLLELQQRIRKGQNINGN